MWVCFQVSSAELRWTDNKMFNASFSVGQSLQGVAVSLRQGAVQPSELPMIGIVRHEMKWYSCNNQRLWCCKVAKAEAVEVCMSSVDTAFLHDATDRWVECDFLPTICSARRVTRSSSTEKVCAATNVCVREEELLRFLLYLKFDEEVDCLITI